MLITKENIILVLTRNVLIWELSSEPMLNWGFIMPLNMGLVRGMLTLIFNLLAGILGTVYFAITMKEVVGT